MSEVDGDVRSTTAGSCVPMRSTLHAPCDLFRFCGKVAQAPPRQRL